MTVDRAFSAHFGWDDAIEELAPVVGTALDAPAVVPVPESEAEAEPLEPEVPCEAEAAPPPPPAPVGTATTATEAVLDAIAEPEGGASPPETLAVIIPSPAYARWEILGPGKM